MTSFTHHLHLYGFTRKLWDFPKSGPYDDLLAEEIAGKFHFYYHPNFRRRCLHLLVKCKRSSSPKNQTPAGFSPDTDRHARRRKRKPDVELAGEPAAEEESAPFTAAPRENTHTSAPSMAAPAKRRAKAAARLRPASPSAGTAALAAGGREQLNPLAPPFCCSTAAPARLPARARLLLRLHQVAPCRPCPTAAFHQGCHLPPPQLCWQQPLLSLCQGHLRARLHPTATARLAPGLQTGQLQAMALAPTPGHARYLPQPF
ncbi:uncharacterized protein LJ206_015232 isoform 1-T2 [Theristicus caerulescens]